MRGFRKLEMGLPMSSSNIAIRAKSLSKRYEIYDNPRQRLQQFFASYLQRIIGQHTKKYFREFWALKEVTFEIKKGETVGIIGRNGSGKSTLLQIICGTLTPTTGVVETCGRVAALLELGSGFNPEFTGRENVYMNAHVLGLSSNQIDARFASIAEFADIGEFIDQPVKSYSSGMYVRLAFAVIAHVDADILIIDEALSVGDAIFTQKCMNFIRKFQRNGTVLLVSHDTASIQSLCKSGIWLRNGRIEQEGTAKNISEAYLQYSLQELYGDDSRLISIAPNKASAENQVDESVVRAEAPQIINYGTIAAVHDNFDLSTGWKTGQADIVSVSLTSMSSNFNGTYEGGERVKIVICAKANKSLHNPILGFLVRDRLGQNLFGENTLSLNNCHKTEAMAGEILEGTFVFKLPMLPNGEYSVMASVAEGNNNDNVQHHWLHDALIIHVYSSRVRYGLVGINFEQVELKITDGQDITS